MRTSHDRLSSKSEDDSDDSERRSLPARAVHGVPAIANVRLEHTAVPMPPREIRTMPVPIQTMFDRRNAEIAMTAMLDNAKNPEHDDDDEDDDEDALAQREDKQRAHPAPADQHPAAPAAEQAIDWPTAEDLAAIEAEVTANEVAAATSPVQDSQLPTPAIPRVANGRQLPISHDVPPLSSAQPSEIQPQPTSTEEYQPPLAHVAPMPAVFSYNQAPATPNVPPTSSSHYNASPPPSAPGAQPPGPPVNRPPLPPNPGYPNPNQPSFGYNAPPPTPAAPASYNQMPSPIPGFNLAPVVPAASRRGVDVLARLGVVGNFLGNRKTRRTLGGKIESVQKKATASFAEVQANQSRMQAEQQRQANQLNTLRTVAEQPAIPLTGFERPSAPAPAAGAETMPLPPITAQSSQEQRPPAPTERLQQLQSAEQPQTDLEHPVELRPKEHVQESSWHRIVVNERGQEVAGAMQYGEGFKKERAKEAISDDVGRGFGAAAASAPTLSQSQGAASYSQSTGQGNLPSGMTSPTLPPGMPTHVDPQHQLPARQKKSDIVPGPVFWVMLIVILAAFFAAASF